MEDSKLNFVAEKRKYKGIKITRDGIEDIFENCSNLTGIKCHPHLLSHTHLTELSEAGFDELFIQLRAGHSSSAFYS